MSVQNPGWGEPKPGARAARTRPIAWLMRSLKVAAFSLGLSAASVGAYWGGLMVQGNFHAVEAGILYRSAQPDRNDLIAAVHQHGVRSVLNLRGRNPGSYWYDEEVGASRELGLAHYDYSLSAKRLVTAQQIAEILNIVRQAPKPLLIHCKSGADRAGLVSALYRFALAGAKAEDADRELSLVYGHFPYLTSRSGAMDDSFWAYVRATPRPSSE